MQPPRISTDVEPPSLAAFLRIARMRRGLSRLQLAARASVSSSYIAQLEQGEKAHPSPGTLTLLVQHLGLGTAERRHAFDLAQLPAPQSDEQPDPEYIAQLRQAIDYLPCIAGLADERWNLLAVNERGAATFPGIGDSGHLLRWYFGHPAAKEVLVEWESEARAMVELWRGAIGAERDNQATASLLDELARYPEFVRLWSEQGVRFHREQPYVHVRDPDTGALSTLHSWLYGSLPGSSAPFVTYIAVRLPYMGPESLCDKEANRVEKR
jgi:transcriptional regulator with XRE-family HTH domain